MPGLAAFPILEILSRSASESDRGHFVRVFADYSKYLRAHHKDILPDWRDALKACLENSRPKERAAHLVALAEIGSEYDQSGAGLRLCSEMPRPFSHAQQIAASDSKTSVTEEAQARNDDSLQTRDRETDISAFAAGADVGALIALVCNPVAWFSAEEMAALVGRARILCDASSDRRLAHALLARIPVRIDMAPLFLEATSEQRWAIALAAQRAELGRRNYGAFATIGRETIALLEYAAIAGNPQQFHDILGRAIGATLELAARIADDPGGEPLVMTLVGIGAPNDVCVRILAAGDMHERGRFRRLHALSRLSGSASPLAARRILAAIISGQSRTPSAASSNATPAQREIRSTSLHPGGLHPKARFAQPRKDSAVGAK